jgi:hypothetical protein
VAVTSKHPQYEDRAEDWQQLVDCYRGERRVKSNRTVYLPATSGMELDGMGTNQPGSRAYNAYLKRAVFPDFVKSAVTTMVGLMHRERATIEVPRALEDVLARTTPKGEDAWTLLRKINEQQLLTGRLGLLVEAPDNAPVGDALPFVALYSAGRVTNWDDGRAEQGRRRLEFVIIEETEFERVTDYNWERRQKHRVLRLSDADDESTVAAGTYTVAVTRDGNEPTAADFVAPSIGGVTLQDIPFIFVNTEDLVTDPDEPPLLGLSNLALAVYRGEADYRQGLFLQGQETLVVIGADELEGDDTRMGAGSRLDLPLEGDAKYIGVSAAGLEEQRNAIENDKKQAAEQGSRLLDFSDGSDASGAALRIRVAAKTPTLISIALTGAAALQEALRIAAAWVGADPDEVRVEANLDFAEDELSGRDLLELMSAKAMGAPISLQSVHRLMRKKDVTTLSYEEELEEINDEEPLGGTGAEDDGDTRGAPADDDDQPPTE